MKKIFQNNKEPLFGRADNIIKLSAFDLATLKEIIFDYNPDYSNDDLLALYSFTGGVPKYVELLCDNTELSVDGMISFMVRENSSFTDEGKNLLVEEFGKNYATYFSILSAISGGINTQPEIEAALGDKSIGGQIKRLIEDYNIIVRQRPLLAKEGFTQWNPDLIYFNNTDVKPTINYEVQKLFGNYSGEEYIASDLTVDNPSAEIQKRIVQSVVRNKENGNLIVKLVNLLPVETTVELSNLKIQGSVIKRTVLRGNPSDKKAVPVSDRWIPNEDKIILPAYSFVVLELIPPFAT
jgi:hypothetical protein